MPATRLASIDALDFSAVLSDLDGVVYRGEVAVPHAVERFRQWQALGVPYCFVTNNAEKSPAEFAAKIERLGIACTAHQVVTSAEVALEYARSRYVEGSRAHVIGSPSFKARVEAAGFVLVETGADAVFVALDRQFNYAMMTVAVRNVLEGAELIGTNPDVLRPTADGFEPGTGAILQAVAAAARVTPAILGKPSGEILRMALQRIGASADQAIMLGDQLDTDILAAHNAGVRGVFLETGVPINRASSVSPDFLLASL